MDFDRGSCLGREIATSRDIIPNCRYSISLTKLEDWMSILVSDGQGQDYGRSAG